MAGWVPFTKVAATQVAAPVPPAFPPGIQLYRQSFKNWSQEIRVDDVWTCAPRTPDEVLRIVNWAQQAGYKIRPRGHMHNWSPLSVSNGSQASPVVLVDTTTYLNQVSIQSGGTVPTVTAQTGVAMETLLKCLEAKGLGLAATPAPGDVTLGGVLAIDGHGTAVPARNEVRSAGHSYGSVSNLVLSLTAVVFDPSRQCYVLRRFSRNDPAIGPLLVHVGRAFIVEATLQVGPNQRMRCQSFIDITTDELFAPQGSRGRTFASYLDSAGRVEAIWYPFTNQPWLKVWTLSPTKPLFVRQTTVPYNYTFSDNVPLPLTNLIGEIIVGARGALTPAFGATQLAITGAGLLATFSLDLWGWANNLTLYVKPTTLRVTANGYAVLTRRADVQRVIHEFTTNYQARIAAYQRRGLYPMNGPVEIRVTGLDQAFEVAMPGAVAPALSAIRPRPDHPEWDVAVWFDILTLPGTGCANAFYREVEQWMMSNYCGSYAAVRVEWSKGWGYSENAAWDDALALGYSIPQSFRDGQSASSNWEAAVASLNAFDPYRIFAAPLHDRLMP